MDVEPTPAHRNAEVESTKTMIERVEKQFDIKPDRLIGDTAYGTAPMLAWMVNEKDIEPHVPVWDKTGRKNESLSISDFNGMKKRRNIVAPRGTPCAESGGPSRTSDHMSRKPTPSSFDPGKQTALNAQ